MISASKLADDFATFLGQETEVANEDGRIAVLTPAEYPDCDGVVVFVESAPEGRYRISDMAIADAMLAGRFGRQGTAQKARGIVDRFGVDYDQGSILVTVDEDELAEACWRVAQASAALAEGVSFEAIKRLGDASFNERLNDVLISARVEVRRDTQLEGLSGRAHRATFFLPGTEAVVEPIAGRKAWSRAEGVYTEFGDLRQVNGYQLVAVVDDALENASQLRGLLGQVGQVAFWSQRTEWLETITQAR